MPKHVWEMSVWTRPQNASWLSTQLPSKTAGLVAGGTVAFQWGGGASVFGGLDATLRSDGSANLSANAGVKAQF